MTESKIPRTIELVEDDGRLIVRIIDQTLLPNKRKMLDLTTVPEVAEAIKSLRIRGAPAIGCAAAAGVALAASRSRAETERGFVSGLYSACNVLAETRPTAVNLFWALERMKAIIGRRPAPDREEMEQHLIEEARDIITDDLQRCRTMGANGAALLPANARVLTHCNAGALATAGYGTALGVIRAGHDSGRVEMVWVDETRPLLQGARLTAWELHEEGIPCCVITDSMAGHVMSRGEVDAVVVGSDRITASGDVANKIGTYSLAILADHHDIPFLVAAPVSTIDFSLDSGDDIPIEERDPSEITHLGGHSQTSVVPEGVEVYSPAFDVTPHEFVTAIITEEGVAEPPFDDALARWRGDEHSGAPD